MLPYLIEPLLRPHVPGNTRKLPGGRHSRIPGAFSPSDPVVVGAQLWRSHHRRPHRLYEGPPEVLVPALRKLPVEGFLTRGVGGWYEAGVGGELVGQAEPGDVSDLVAYQHTEEVAYSRDAFQEFHCLVTTGEILYQPFGRACPFPHFRKQP